MKIQSKITLFLSLIVVIFILFAFYQFRSQNKSFSVLLEDTKKQQIVLFDKLLLVEGKNTEVFVRDYTFWDEMVDFISSKDKTFAEENIDTGAETFNASMVGVYDTKHTLVYGLENEGVAIPSQVFEKLDKERFAHFFIKSGGNIIEMRGATVHPTDDAERETAPRGYFFAGRILDEEYIQVLADITRSFVFILPALPENKGELDTTDSSRGFISFVRNLPGWDGVPVGYLHVEKEFFGISQFYASLSRQFWTFSIFLFALIILVYIFLVRFVAKPLRILSRGIRDQNTKPIEGMKEEKSEFGDLAGLVLRFSEKIEIAKSEFVSLVSHQLRTPLTIAGWYLERLEKILRGENCSPKSLEYMNGIGDANKRMLDLVNATVEISRIESGNLNLRLAPTDVGQIAEEVTKELNPAMETKGIIFEKKISRDLPHPILDERMVFIAVENILSNAIKYTDGGGRVNLSVGAENGIIVVSVSDTGIGISSEERSKIFEKLFRAKSAREKDPEGSGLGLYIAKALTEAQGGTIELSSIEGKGTTFIVKLPLSPRKTN